VLARDVQRCLRQLGVEAEDGEAVDEPLPHDGVEHLLLATRTRARHNLLHLDAVSMTCEQQRTPENDGQPNLTTGA
jgi:hypothetical protein